MFARTSLIAFQCPRGSGPRMCERSEQILSNQPVYQIPDEESCKLTDQQQDHCPAWSGFVEAQGYGYDVSDEGYPGCQGEPDSVAVDLGFLLGEGFRLDFEPFLYPFPFADPSDPVGRDASKPVAECAYDETTQRVLGGRQDGYI